MSPLAVEYEMGIDIQQLQAERQTEVQAVNPRKIRFEPSNLGAGFVRRHFGMLN
jgi:hypothetical protein